MNFACVNSVRLSHQVRHQTGRLPGSRPWLVMIHALGTEQRIWEPVLAELGGDFNVLTYDLRGHGLSAAPEGPYSMDTHVADLLGLMDSVGIERATLVGVSVGAQIAVATVAAAAAGRITALVLCNSGLRIGSSSSWGERIAAVSSGGMAAVADAVVDGWLFKASSDCRQGYREMLLRTPVEGYLGTASTLRDTDLSQIAGRVKLPVLCLASTEDRATPPAVTEQLSQALAGSAFKLLPLSAHLPVLERPADFAAHLREFLESLQECGPYERGMGKRRFVFGDAYVDRAGRDATEFEQDFQRFVTEGPWANLWTRDYLTDRERSLITLAILATLTQDEEVELHVRATRNTGASKRDVTEALLHVAVYAGFPAANAAFRAARKAYGQEAV